MINRLSLTNFRCYREALLVPGEGFVLLVGDNGAGKTNILEALSLLAPGRGLRGASLADMARDDGPGGFSVAVRSPSEGEIGTGASPSAPERRQVRINGAAAAVNSLGERFALLWVTPAMDRLFAEGASARRRFLDRLVLALEPGHAHHAARYEAAMRARTKLLGQGDLDPDWLGSLEAAMDEHGSALAGARLRTVAALDEQLAAQRDDEFPLAKLALTGWGEDNLAARLRSNRARDAAAGRATEGPHRHDLAAFHRASAMPAARCSTGEQKALMLGMLLAHAGLVADRRGQPPILLLDEVAAHLDTRRRARLFERLEGRGQVWITATDQSLLAGIGSASRYRVADGAVHPL